MKLIYSLLILSFFAVCSQAKLQVSYNWDKDNFVPVNCSQVINWQDNVNSILFKANDRLCTNSSKYILQKPNPTDPYVKSRLDLANWNHAKTEFRCYSDTDYELKCYIQKDNTIIIYPLTIGFDFRWGNSEAACSDPNNLLSCTVELDIRDAAGDEYTALQGIVGLISGIVCFLLGVCALLAASNNNGWTDGLLLICIIFMMASHITLYVISLDKWMMPHSRHDYFKMIMLIIFLGYPVVSIIWVVIAYILVYVSNCLSEIECNYLSGITNACSKIKIMFVNTFCLKRFRQQTDEHPNVAV